MNRSLNSLVKTLSLTTGIEVEALKNYLDFSDKFGLDFNTIINDYLCEVEYPVNEIKWVDEIDGILERGFYHFMTFNLGYEINDIENFITVEGEGKDLCIIRFDDNEAFSDLQELVNYLEDCVSVAFRNVTYPDGTREILALFPYVDADNRGNVLSYAHNGQHSAAYLDGIMSMSQPATTDEYQNLFNELKGQGYKRIVVISEGFL